MKPFSQHRNEMRSIIGTAWDGVDVKRELDESRGAPREITITPFAIQLPWPPSVNGYWRHVNGQSIVSRKGREYRQAVAMAVLLGGDRRTLTGSLRMTIAAYPPDQRRRDIDNLCKGVLDGLAKAGVYEDDFQIQKLTIERLRPSKPGRLLVEIYEA